MAKKRTKTINLYLTTWQKRMIRDMTSKRLLRGLTFRELNMLKLEYGPESCPASYRLSPHGFRKDDYLLYLTDEQMVAVAKELGLSKKVTTLNISPPEIENGFITFAA